MYIWKCCECKYRLQLYIYALMIILKYDLNTEIKGINFFETVSDNSTKSKPFDLFFSI